MQACLQSSSVVTLVTALPGGESISLEPWPSHQQLRCAWSVHAAGAAGAGASGDGVGSGASGGHPGGVTGDGARASFHRCGGGAGSGSGGDGRDGGMSGGGASEGGGDDEIAIEAWW